MTDVWQLPAMWTLEDKTTVAICDTGFNFKCRVIINESGLYCLILSTNPSAAMWTRKTRG